MIIHVHEEKNFSSYYINNQTEPHTFTLLIFKVQLTTHQIRNNHMIVFLTGLVNLKKVLGPHV